MKFVDDMYEFYRDKLIGDEEDIELLVYTFLQEMTYNDLIQLIRSMDKEELYDFVGLYLSEALKGKFAEDEEKQRSHLSFHSKNIH